MSLFLKHFDEIQIGDRETTRARTVTEADIVNFCYLSGDWFPLHSDAEYAAGTQFGGRIAHGYLVVAIASGLMIPPVPGPILANYGADDLRFVAPVRIGDTIRVQVEVVGKQAKGATRGVVDYAMTVQNQREEPVVRLIMKALIAAREAA